MWLLVVKGSVFLNFIEQKMKWGQIVIRILLTTMVYLILIASFWGVVISNINQSFVIWSTPWFESFHL